MSDQDLDEANNIVREILDNHFTSADAISPSGELFRVINRFHRAQSLRRALQEFETGQQEAGETSNVRVMPPIGQRDRHRPRPPSAPPTNPASPPLPAALPPPTRSRQTARRGRGRPQRSPRSAIIHPSASSEERARPRLTESGRVLELHRSLTEERRQAMNLQNIADMREAGQQLQEATSHLRAVLDTPMANFTQQNLAAEEIAGEAETMRSFKRRKLENESTEVEVAEVSYGRYGQVEPGKLDMEIEFCDGGMYPAEHGGDYGAANVLKNDSTVYCTKGNRCNLVLKHRGGRPFCLQELIIKAPPSGFTAPVQEGMVFVSMTSDDLLTRTAQYQIQYPRGKKIPHGPPRRDPIISIRHNPDGSTETLSSRPSYNRPGDEQYYPLAQIPVEFTDLRAAPPFHITTSCSDSDSDSDTEQPTRRRRRMTPLFDDGAPSSSSSSESSDMNIDFSGSYFDQMGHSRVRARQRSQPSSISIGLSSAIEAAQEATQEAVKAVGGNLMAPHARFYIEQDKSRCSVKFDPPVSGRFILLKMWSPVLSPGGNIDIQSVVVKGFAGPRFFPATQMM